MEKKGIEKLIKTFVMKKVFYSFKGLPNQWIDSNDKSYPSSYFLDKKYDDSKLFESVERVKVLMGVNSVIEESDSNAENWLKRRLNRDTLSPHIINLLYAPIICDAYENAEEFAKELVMEGVASFMTIDEEFMDTPKFDVYQDLIFDMCYKWFAESLIKYHNEKCK